MKLPKELITVTPLSRIVALFVFAAVLAIGFGLGINYQETIELLKKENSLAPTIIIQPTTPTLDLTANWKTYASRQLRYEVKYSLTWKIIDLLYGAVRIESKERRENKKDEPKYSLEISQRLKLSPYFKSYEAVASASGLTFEAGEPVVEKKSNRNLSVYYYVTSNTGSKTIIIPIPNTQEDYLELRMQMWPDGEPTIIFDQILSTFKFTN